MRRMIPDRHRQGGGAHFGVLASIVAGVAGVAASPECFDIVTANLPIPGEDGWIEGGICHTSCNTQFDRLIPGTECQFAQSVGGGVEVFCLEGTLRKNLDGTWACRGPYDDYIGTESADIECVQPCLGGGGGGQ